MATRVPSGIVGPATAIPADVDDATSFASFVRPFWGDLHRLACRLSGALDGDDVLQDALAAAWRKRAQYRPERGTARSWLLAIVADQAFKHARRRKSILLADPPDAPENAEPNAAALDVGRALARLAPRQRLVVSLYYYVDLPVADIAQVMSCSVGTVKSTLSDARERLRVALGDDY